MMLSACSTNQQQGLINREDARLDSIEDMNEELTERKFVIDPSLLVVCDPPNKYESGDLKVFIKTHNSNVNRHIECYIRLNSLVETINIINKSTK